MAAWHETYELPPPGNMMKSGEKGRQAFIDIGNMLAETLSAEMIKHLGKLDESVKVLEFGCGDGRIVLPLFHQYRKPDACVDVNPLSIEYLQRAIPEANPQKTVYVPPLPFEDESFDCVYAISVWTHLPLQLQWPWLREINRVLKMGGLALISTSGFRALRYRREQRGQEGWRGVSDDDLRLEGQIYKGVDASKNPGVTGDYGYVAHDPDWVRQEWGRLFEIKDIQVEGAAKMQDLNVMVKTRPIGPSDLDCL